MSTHLANGNETSVDAVMRADDFFQMDGAATEPDTLKRKCDAAQGSMTPEMAKH